MNLIIVKIILIAIIVLASMSSIIKLWTTLLKVLLKYEHVKFGLKIEVIMLTLSIAILSVI